MKIARFLAIFLVLALLSPGALAESEKTFVLMGLEQDSNERDWAASQFFTRMREKTGVAFTFDEYHDRTLYSAAKQGVLSGDAILPDALFKAELTPQEEMAAAESGRLVDLSPYLAEYAPNLSAILDARPDWRAIITQPSGAITSLPALSGADRECCVWINQSWLDALELEMPQTIDEYTEVLRAFRDRDPNANGRRDEVPLALVGPWEAKFLMHAFGLAPDDYNIYIDDAGAVQFAPLQPEFRRFVEWLNMALSESLIDSGAFRQTHSAQYYQINDSDDAASAIGGMIALTPYSVVDMDLTINFSALRPLEHNGTRVYRRLLSGVTRGAFAITSACGDIPSLLAWVDILYTEEGGRLAFAGLEGEDYTLKADGAWRWSESDEDVMRLSGILESSIIAGDGRTPGLEPAAFMRNSEITADNHARRQSDIVREYSVLPFPATWPTDADREARIAELQAALAPVVDTAIANFAMGLTPLTEDGWAAFEAELYDLGVSEFLSLWQEKLDETAV